MRIEEIDAMLGIETEAATSAELMKRAVEFCNEMYDCYEPGTLEHTAFFALHYAIAVSRFKDKLDSETEE